MAREPRSRVTNDPSTGNAGGARTIVSRFAPSPTGRLHAGHALSAIRAHDLARAGGGRFLLRIEDIDGTRSRPEHVAGIVEDLRWLGLEWDGDMLFQSQRLDAYAAVLERLRAMGLLYRCVCTRADIAEAGAAPHGAPQGSGGALYPGTCRGRTVDPGVPHAWRIDMAQAVALTGPIAWYDARAGRIVANPLAHGDVVLARKDAPSSYHLAVTVDDAHQGVTDVVRGRDLFAATDVHRLLQALLKLPTPRYHHHELLTDGEGRRLAKRHGSPSLSDLRAQGIDGRAYAMALRAGPHTLGFGVRKD
jgi:glutamyl-Q tRNA(Asp) synthetase